MKTIPRKYEIRIARITVSDQGDFLRRLRGIMRAHDATVICFNAENMAGTQHAKAALTHAIRSFSGGSPIAKTLEMEALLYAAGTRQCAEAAAFGIHEGKNIVYVCCCPPRTEIWEALSRFMDLVDVEGDIFNSEKIARLRILFMITDEELAAAGGDDRLQDLVIERVALLDAYR